MAGDIKIFMCAHKLLYTVPPLTVGVQGGAVLSQKLQGTIPDFGPSGSISEKNPDYCELTVQYYAYKNVDADYYGFCHYRRLFLFDDTVKAPYLVFGKPTERVLKRITPDEATVRAAVKSADVILPRPENMGVSVAEQFATVPACTGEDLKLFCELIDKHLPELTAAKNEYLCGTKQYFCNMFVMKREIFFDYCQMLFPLLSEFDKIKSPNGEIRGDRLDGYLAERFLGIYATYLKSLGKKIKELPRADIGCPFKKRILYKLLPPESRLRFIIKRRLHRSRKGV